MDHLAPACGFSTSSLLDEPAVSTKSETDLDRIGQVTEFVEEVPADEIRHPDPRQIGETVTAIFKQEMLAFWEISSSFDSRQYQELVKALVGRR